MIKNLTVLLLSIPDTLKQQDKGRFFNYCVWIWRMGSAAQLPVQDACPTNRETSTFHVKPLIFSHLIRGGRGKKAMSEQQCGIRWLVLFGERIGMKNILRVVFFCPE